LNKDQLKYPIKFTPILKEKIWGGNKLNKLFNKATQNNIGESWEISDIENNVSFVNNGILKGKSLTQLIDCFRGDLIGNSVYKSFGNNFPLLFKFIDAKPEWVAAVRRRHHVVDGRMRLCIRRPIAQHRCTRVA